MAEVDFSDSPLMIKPLDLKFGDKIYRVRPTADDQARMMRMHHAVMQTAQAKNKNTQVRDFLDADDQVLVDDDDALARVQLGESAFDQMLADGLPLLNVRRMASYSFNYHVAGAEYADAILAARTGVADDAADPDSVGADGLPKASTTGPSTGSGSPTRTGSTKGTGSRSGSGKSSTRKPAAKR